MDGECIHAHVVSFKLFAIFLTQMSSLAPYTPLGASYTTSDPNTNAAFFANAHIANGSLAHMLGRVQIGGCNELKRGARFNLPPRCVIPEAVTAATRCCMHTRIPESVDKQCHVARGAHGSLGFCLSVDAPQCRAGSGSGVSLLAPHTFAAGASAANATWSEAAAECAAHGRVLCSHKQLAHTCCCRQGCKLDTRYVWARTACQLEHGAMRASTSNARRVAVAAYKNATPLTRVPRCVSTNATQQSEPQRASAVARYLYDVRRRWQDRLQVRHVGFGDYDGCHSRIAGGGVLWLHMFGHTRASVEFKLYSNWKAVLAASHACFFISLVTRSETQVGDSTEQNARHACPAGSSNAGAAVKAATMAEHLGTNFAYTIHARGGSGSCFCAGESVRESDRRDWPNCNTDWHVSSALFGGHVATTHGIPTRYNDIVIMARPDAWLPRSLDYSALTDHVRASRRQLLVGFMHGGDGFVDNFYVHTRGVVEDLCVRNFDTPAGPGHPPGCPMCYGTHSARPDPTPNGQQPWSCGFVINRLALAASNAGTQTLLVRGGGGFSLCIADKKMSAQANPCRVVENPSAFESVADGCAPGPPSCKKKRWWRHCASCTSSPTNHIKSPASITHAEGAHTPDSPSIHSLADARLLPVACLHMHTCTHAHVRVHIYVPCVYKQVPQRHVARLRGCSTVTSST